MAVLGARWSGDRAAAAALALSLLGLFGWAASAGAQRDPIRIKVVGGLADVSQYVRYEEPFWRRRIAVLSGGRLQAEIVPSDRAGFRSQEMLQLMRLGVVTFGTALLAVVSTEEPEFNAIDLPILNPDMPRLRRSVALYRPYLEEILRERYSTQLLAVYTYPAQVVWCTRPFSALSDLAGRRVRTSSVGQADLMQALGATAVVTGFAEIVQAIRNGVVECAITGTLSGNAIGLHEVTTHIHALAINWGVSVFGANLNAWNSLPSDLRERMVAGLHQLEREVWDGAELETGDGLACNQGLPTCQAGRRGNMTVVPVGPADEARRPSLLVDAVLPRWVERCGPDCAEAWNSRLAPALGIRAPSD